MAEYQEFAMDEPSGVEVRMTDAKGKGLFAIKSFAIDEVIFEEKPLVSCQFSWNKAYKYLACDFCMRPLETAQDNARRLSGNTQLVLPYPECSPTKNETVDQCPSCGEQYCSSACRDDAWRQHHKTLCLQSTENPAHPLYQLNESWKQMHYPPETSSIMLLARMMATVIQSSNKEAAMQSFLQFCHRAENEEEEIAHKLLGEKFASQLQLLCELMSQALYSESIQQWLIPEGFRSMVALVGTNGQGVGTSPLSEWVKRVSSLELSEDERKEVDKFIDKLYDDLDEVCGDFLNSEGSALFALQSACNHSCDPNAVSSFSHGNFQLVMSATQKIDAGDEILISYLDDCVLQRSRHTRQKILRENYLFSCQCSKCLAQADDPDETSEEEDESDDDDM